MLLVLLGPWTPHSKVLFIYLYYQFLNSFVFVLIFGFGYCI